MAVIIESKRDQRILDWLISQVGEAAVMGACDRLSGQRRTYPSNLAKALGLVPPKELAPAAKDDARRHLDEIARHLGIHPQKEEPNGTA
jgi:hypothetical protein